jgi:hypothetical protein
MRNIILLTLFITNCSIGQEMDNILKQDTIYVMFEASVDQRKLDIKGYHNNGYSFLKTIFFKSEVIVDSHYENTKIRDAKVLCKPKNFLKTIQKNTIDVAFMRKQRNNIFVNSLFGTDKIYFIIDPAEYKKNIVILREVNSPVIILE